MSVTYGFYNALEHDRKYDAIQVSQIFDGIIGNGVYETLGGALMVKAGSGMTVNVQTGRAWFDHTWTYNDAILPLEIGGADSIVNRIDAVILEVDERKTVRENAIKVIRGTPASSPSRPALTNTTEIHQYPLAYVYIGADVTEITQSAITNMVGTSACPFVTGIIDTLSIDELITQWQTEWQEWFAAQPGVFLAWRNQFEADAEAWKSEFQSEMTTWERTQQSNYSKWKSDQESDYESWRAAQEGTYEDWIQTHQDDFLTFEQSQEMSWTTWSTTQRQRFDDWFANIQYVLDGDVAGHLQVEIDNIEINVEKKLEEQLEEVDNRMKPVEEDIEWLKENAGSLFVDAESYISVDYDKVRVVVNG